MNDETKTWVLLLVLLGLLILFLSRKKVGAEVSFKITEPGFEGLSVQQQLNTALLRICTYEGGGQGPVSVTWPTQTQCSPAYNGIPLVSDKITPKL